jgi:hypothetical protein
MPEPLYGRKLNDKLSAGYIANKTHGISVTGNKFVVRINNRTALYFTTRNSLLKGPISFHAWCCIPTGLRLSQRHGSLVEEGVIGPYMVVDCSGPYVCPSAVVLLLLTAKWPLPVFMVIGEGTCTSDRIKKMGPLVLRSTFISLLLLFFLCCSPAYLLL